MEFLPADYVLGALVLVLAVTGLFRGLSGTLAFFAASAAALLVGIEAWPLSATVTPVPWMRGGLVLLAVLLAFGLVRVVVRKFVHGLLAQPADAVVGFLVGAAFGAAVIVGWAYSGFHLEQSALATEVSAYVR